jgi:hypothetical protein
MVKVWGGQAEGGVPSKGSEGKRVSEPERRDDSFE